MTNVQQTRRGVRDRAHLAAALRLAGATYQEISAQLGWASRSSAHRSVQRQLAAVDVESAETLRALEAMRLDRMWASLWPAALGTFAVPPDPVACRLLLAIHDRRVRLFRLADEAEVDLEEELRELARREGLDPEDVLHEAEALIVLDGQRQRGRRRSGGP